METHFPNFPTSPADPPSSRKGSDSGVIRVPPGRRVALGFLSELPAFAALLALIVLLGCFLAAFTESQKPASNLPEWGMVGSREIEVTLFP